MKKRQGVPVNEEQKRGSGRQNQVSSSCSTGQNTQDETVGVSEQAVDHQGGWRAQDQHRSLWRWTPLSPVPQLRDSLSLWHRFPLGLPMAARSLPSCNECPALWAGGAQNPWGDTHRAGLDQSAEETPRRLFSATCSLQLLWEVHERTQDLLSATHWKHKRSLLHQGWARASHYFLRRRILFYLTNF